MKAESDMTSSTQENELSPTEVELVIKQAEKALARSGQDGHQARADHPPDANGSDEPEPEIEQKRGPKPKHRPPAGTAAGLAGGEAARRTVKEAVDLKEVIAVARRVGSRQTNGMSDDQVLRWLADKPGRMRTLGGHLFERLDAKDAETLHKLTGGRTPLLKLYPAHNRPGLDGAWKGGRSTATGAKHVQHKLSNNEQWLKKAADKTNPRLRGKTELVVGRKTKVKPKTAEGLKGVRQAGRSVKDIDKMIQKAADPKKIRKTGTHAAQKLTLKASGGAAALGAGISVASDLRGLAKGEKTCGEVAENAAWAGGEAALATVGTAAATAAAAPTIAAGTAALAASSAAGTTAMAAGLATLGPIGLGIGVGIGVGFGVKKVRQAVRA